jgi:phasin protein
MRKPKKTTSASSKKRARQLVTRRPLASRSGKRGQKTRHKSAAAHRATAPIIWQDVQKHAAQSDADVLSLRSVREILDSGSIPVPPSKADDGENLGSRTGDTEQRRPFLPSSVFASGVNAITNVSSISMEWFSLLLRSTERSLGAMQTVMHCRTPGEFFTAYSNLLKANLNDAFEGAEKVLSQTRQ